MRRTCEQRDTYHDKIVGVELPGQPAGDVTQLLVRAREGNREAVEELLPLVYTELQRVARRQLRNERGDHTLGASGLINEAYLKLVDQLQVDWQSREHFYAIAACAMRQVLIDYARKRNAEKRGGDWARTSLDNIAVDNKGVGFDAPLADLLALDQALERLSGIDERLRRIVEYRFFCGLTEMETAELIGVTVRTVQRDWIKARAWLYNELYSGDN